MVEINLLPPQYRKQSQPNVWKYATWALLPVTAAALLIPWLMTSTKAGDLQKQIDAVQGDIDTLTPQRSEYSRLLAHQRELEQVTTIAQTLRDQKTYWSNDLAAFSAQIPANSGVGLTSMTVTSVAPATPAAPTPAPAPASAAGNTAYDGKAVRRQITLQGQATSEQAVINFLNTFENSPNFGVQFHGMQRDATSNTYTFNADVGVVGASSAAEEKAAADASAAPNAAAPGTAAPQATARAGAGAASPAAGGTNVK